jgi:hypothetical protein
MFDLRTLPCWIHSLQRGNYRANGVAGRDEIKDARRGNSIRLTDSAPLPRL